MTTTDLVTSLAATIETRIRTIGGERYLVPDTQNWADWQDDDAIRHHGQMVGSLTPAKIASQMLGALGLAKWDGDDVPEEPDYNDLFALCRRWNTFG